MSDHDNDVSRAITDALTALWRYDQAHVHPFRERLDAIGAKGNHREELYQAWSRVIRTQQNILARLAGKRIPSFADYDETTGRTDNPVPTLAQLEALTDAELVDAIEAAEMSLRDCTVATRSIGSRDGSGPADYWLGDDAPSHLFQKYAEWFTGALGILRKLRQRRALTDNRAGTQFSALDEASPTVTVQVRMPASLVARADARAIELGVTRSELIRAALETATR